MSARVEFWTFHVSTYGILDFVVQYGLVCFMILI